MYEQARKTCIRRTFINDISHSRKRGGRSSVTNARFVGSMERNKEGRKRGREVRREIELGAE